MLRFMDRQTEKKTPVLVKAGVIVTAFFLLGSVNQVLTGKIEALPSVISLVVQIVALIGLWNMHRWAVLMLVLLAVISVAMVSDLTQSHRVLVAIITLRSFALVPGIVYWRRLTW